MLRTTSAPGVELVANYVLCVCVRCFVVAHVRWPPYRRSLKHNCAQSSHLIEHSLAGRPEATTPCQPTQVLHELWWHAPCEPCFHATTER